MSQLTDLMAQPVISQPTSQIIGNVNGHRDWSSGLCGCFEDCGSCIMTCLCLPCMECRNASRLGEFFCLPFCCPGSNVAVRARLRTLGGIQGSICKDICAYAFCPACVVCQMSRELDNMGL